MTAHKIDGILLAERVKINVAHRAQNVSKNLGRAPCIAVVLVGDDPASAVYVKSKSKNARKCGIHALDVKFPANVSQIELERKLRDLSADVTVDGILLQLPLPKGLDEFAALNAIDPKKDVDGLHPLNQGLLLRGAKEIADAPSMQPCPCMRPCTPLGALELIDFAREELGETSDLSGLHAVIVGRSILVGKPMALLLLERQCTVVICHSRTRNLQDEIRRADIVVAAVGKPRLIKGEHLKVGSIVIDVGINRLESGEIVGDVDYDSACEVASAVTPVPGGCGPMTIAMLLSNTVSAAQSKIAALK